MLPVWGKFINEIAIEDGVRNESPVDVGYVVFVEGLIEKYCFECLV